MEESDLPPGSAATQAAKETPVASQTPSATAQEPSVPSASAQAPPLPPTANEAPPAPPASTQAPSAPPASNQAPPTPAQAPPPNPAQAPPPPTTATVHPPARSKKRPLDVNFQIENSNYFKMRLVLKDLRPHFLEVLRAPDFRSCKAANEIREKMKLMLELYQQMTRETARGECATKSESLPNGNGVDQTPQNISTRSSETWSFQAGSASEKQQTEGGDQSGNPVVGGSAFGWNFITCEGGELVYYGMTKEEYRSSHPIAETVVEA